MTEVQLSIGGRLHAVACRDGEEGRVKLLGDMIAARWPAAQRAAGISAERAMFFVALMLADDLDEAETRPPQNAPASAAPVAGVALSEAALTRIADRLEHLANTLEQAPQSA